MVNCGMCLYRLAPHCDKKLLDHVPPLRKRTLDLSLANFLGPLACRGEAGLHTNGVFKSANDELACPTQFHRLRQLLLLRMTEIEQSSIARMTGRESVYGGCEHFNIFLDCV